MTADEAVTVPHNLSYSQKSTLSDCGGRYYLERVQKVPQRPGWANVGGTAGHSTSEELDRRLYETGEHIGDLGTIAEIFGSYFQQEVEKTERVTGFERTEFRPSGRASKEWPNKEDATWWARKGPEMVLAWIRWRDASPFQIAVLTPGPGLQCPDCKASGKQYNTDLDCTSCENGYVPERPMLGIEVPFDIIRGGAQVVGKIDRVEVMETEDGPVYRVNDLKFGAREPESADQLVTYRSGLLDNYGIDPQWGTYWLARKGMSTPAADLRQVPLERVDYEYRLAQEQRLRGDFRYHPANNCVSWCSVRAYCPIANGEFAHTVPQPWELSAPPVLRPPSARV